MNICEQDMLVRGLLAMADQLCVYRKPGTFERAEFCDCKYGVSKDQRIGTSERGSGCPEVCAAAALIDLLTPQEYETLIARHNLMLKGGLLESDKQILIQIQERRRATGELTWFMQRAYVDIATLQSEFDRVYPVSQRDESAFEYLICKEGSERFIMERVMGIS